MMVKPFGPKDHDSRMRASRRQPAFLDVSPDIALAPQRDRPRSGSCLGKGLFLSFSPVM
jgi:hypothetical protein